LHKKRREKTKEAKGDKRVALGRRNMERIRGESEGKKRETPPGRTEEGQGNGSKVQGGRRMSPGASGIRSDSLPRSKPSGMFEE